MNAVNRHMWQSRQTRKCPAILTGGLSTSPAIPEPIVCPAFQPSQLRRSPRVVHKPVS